MQREGTTPSRMVKRETQKRTCDTEQLWDGPKRRQNKALTQMGRARGKTEHRRRIIQGSQNKVRTMVDRRTETTRNGKDYT